VNAPRVEFMVETTQPFLGEVMQAQAVSERHEGD
jgi:hypothetical protein